MAGSTHYASLTLTDSYVHHNTARAYLAASGGGIALGGRATIEGSTIAHNTAQNGGGLAGGPTVRLEDSTVSGNLATGGYYDQRWVEGYYQPVQEWVWVPAHRGPFAVATNAW